MILSNNGQPYTRCCKFSLMSNAHGILFTRCTSRETPYTTCRAILKIVCHTAENKIFLSPGDMIYPALSCRLMKQTYTMGGLGQYNFHSLDIIDWNACTKVWSGNVWKWKKYHNIITCVSVGVWHLSEIYLFNNTRWYNINVDKKRKLDQGIYLQIILPLSHTLYVLLTSINGSSLTLHLNSWCIELINWYCLISVNIKPNHHWFCCCQF